MPTPSPCAAASDADARDAAPRRPDASASPDASARRGATPHPDSERADAAGARIGGWQVWRRFIGYYAKYRLLFWFDLVCATVLACIDLAFPQLLNFFTRDFFLRDAGTVLSSLGLIAALMVAMYAVRTACQYFIACWGHIMGARMEADMRMDLFSQYQRLSFSYYDRNNTGEMMSRLVTDLFDISEFAHHGPENFFICTLKIVGSFALLFFVNVPLTLIMLAATAVMAAYTVWANYRKRVIFTENRRKMAEINARSQDSLGGVRVVKSFGNERLEVSKFGRSNRRFISTKESSYRFMGEFHAANSLFTGVLYTITIVGGGYFLVQGQMQPTDLAIYALYIGIFISPIEQLINFMEQFQKGYAGFRRFAEVLALRPDIEDAPGAKDLADAVREAREKRGRKQEARGGEQGMAGAHDEGATRGERTGADSARGRHPEGEGAAGQPGVAAQGAAGDAACPIAGDIRYENVTFSYDGCTNVLDGLSLHVPAGTTVALVGPSGGGKTTTCSLLPRFYDVAGGSVQIDGVDVRDVTVESLRAAVGIVQQDVYLFDGTIRDNIAYGNPDASDEEIVAAARRANIHDAIMELEDGYDTNVGERGARLSGGQKQRISIARVFLRDPRILILDEATSALDNESERRVQESLAALSRGRTTLVIAHRLSTIRGADLIAVVDGGRIAEAGTHDDLLSRGGTYASYYAMQFGR